MSHAFLSFRQPQFLAALVNELADGGKSQVARMAAGLQLKNQLTSKDPTVRMQYQQRWISLSDELKNHVKTRVRDKMWLVLLVFCEVLK